MFSAERILRASPIPLGLLACLCAPLAPGGDFVVGLGAEADTEDGVAVAALADFAVGEQTWAGFSLAHSQMDGAVLDDTRYADLELDHSFEPLGVRIGAAYWGDPDLLESIDLRGSVYARKEEYTIAAEYEHREFELTIGGAVLPARTVEFSADGLGFSARRELSDKFEIYGSGMWYEYSRDVRLEQDVDALRLLSRSRLALMNSLIDYRWQAGIETTFGLKLADLRVGSWRNAVDGERVDTISAGFLTPVGRRSDMEFRLSFDHSDAFGSSTVLSVFLYLFGSS